MNDKHDLEDIDNFWDLESLLPQRRKIPQTNSLNTDAVEIDFGEDDKNTDDRFGGSSIPLKRIPHEHKDRVSRAKEVSMQIKARQNEPVLLEPYLVYSPDNPLIEKVSVSKWQTRFNFYNRFRSDTARLWERTATECKPVPFFSYIPQHNQLSYTELDWYIYWRSQMRNGIYIDTDYSYILLFIYEIINSPDLIPPKDGLDMLCFIWSACRKSFLRIDNYLADWVCDYCLIHELPCPIEKLQPFLRSAMAASSFKEFYMDGKKFGSAADMMSITSNYDWRNSKYVTSENIALFSENIGNAFSKVYNEILLKNSTPFGETKNVICRDSYNGALCTWEMKRCINIEYISRSRSPKFRFIATDIVKYSENRIRAALGIKARLKADSLTDEMKDCIDEYFNENLPIPAKKSKTKIITPQNEYESLYEPADSKFSLENALEIEKDSWSTTEILTSALNDSENVELPSSEKADIPLPTCENPNTDTQNGQNEFEEFAASLDKVSLEAMRKLLSGDEKAIEKTAAEYLTLSDALAEKINETAFDMIGDSVIEQTENGHRIICDYEEEIRSCLK